MRNHALDEMLQAYKKDAEERLKKLEAGVHNGTTSVDEKLEMLNTTLKDAVVEMSEKVSESSTELWRNLTGSLASSKDVEELRKIGEDVKAELTGKMEKLNQSIANWVEK